MPVDMLTSQVLKFKINSLLCNTEQQIIKTGYSQMVRLPITINARAKFYFVNQEFKDCSPLELCFTKTPNWV